MTAIKDMKAFDSEGESINKVEQALAGVNVKLRDSNGGFRNMQDVLDELSQKWNTFTKEDQMFIAQQIGGVRQQNIILALLSNRVEMQKQLTAEINSSGLAEQRYAIYQQGLEAAQNRLTASWEKLAQTSVSSGLLTQVYDLAAGFLDLADRVGGIPAILGVAITSLIAFNGVAALTAAGITGIGDAWAAVTLLLEANPFGLIVLGIGAAVLAFNYFYENASEKLDRLNKQIADTGDKIASLKNNVATIHDLVTEYEDLKNKTSLTGEESQRLLDVQTKLKELVPTLSGHFDEYGNFILDATNDMNSLTNATLEQIKAQEKLRQASIDQTAQISAQALLDAQKKQTLANQGYSSISGGGKAGRAGVAITETQKIQVNLDWTNALNQSKAAFAEMSDDAKMAFIKSLGSSNLAGVFTDLMKSEKSAAIEQASINKDASLSMVTLDKNTKNATTAFVDLATTMKTVGGALSDVDGLISDYNKNGLKLADVSKVPPQYIDALSIEGDHLKLNIDLIKQKQLATVKDSLESIKAAEASGQATAQQVQIVQAVYNQLMADNEQTFGAFHQTAAQYDTLLWQIANDAENAGYKFYDMSGKAMTSAQDIHDYMAGSQANFNNFVVQAANATGQTVAQVMNTVQSMAQQTANNVMALIAQLGNAMGAEAARYEGLAGLYGASITHGNAPVNLFSTPAPVGGYYSANSGGGGGGSSSKASDKAAKQAKIDQQIKDAQQAAENSLKNQLDTYKKLLDARKQMLDSLVTEKKYQEDVADKNKTILDLQNQIATLQLDKTPQAKAQVQLLQDQLQKAQRDLGDTQLQHSVDAQKAALDAEYQAFADKINGAIDSVKSINASSLSSFTKQLSAILAGIGQLPQFHEGGIVGSDGASGKGNEVLAKLKTGERVLTSAQNEDLFGRLLPQLTQAIVTPQSTSMGDFQFNVNVAGSLDKTVIPDIQKVADGVMDKINKAMLSRGYNRRTDLYSSG